MAKAKWAWIIALGGLIVFDIAMVACNDVPGDTLSEFVWSIEDPRLTFFIGTGLGTVLGHLFWQRKR